LSHANGFPRKGGRWGVAAVLGLIAALVLALLPGPADAATKKKAKVGELTVMTRNLYLGANLRPIISTTDVNQAVDIAGVAGNQAHATRFPSVRAALLAKEIRKKAPDVVGLQEVALYRTAPTNLGAVLNPSATQLDPLGGDFLAELLKRLNKKSKKGKQPLSYRLAVVHDELDAEFPVNDDGQGSGLAGADHNERLTLRDAILVRKGGGIKFTNPTSGTFNTVLRPTIGGAVSIHVNRGWTAIDVKASGRKVHFVNTHLEAYDDQASNSANDGSAYPKGGIREAQAKQLVGPGGAANRPRTVLVGDLNADFPVRGDQVFPGDALAFQAVLAGGFRDRGPTPPPFSCCLGDPLLTNPSKAGVDHQVDFIMSNSKKIRFKKGAITSTYANGLWSADHFGIFSQLLIR
jgi:endonuclease/exonuclease/phosphatase family metal-dependent hydrolase